MNAWREIYCAATKLRTGRFAPPGHHAWHDLAVGDFHCLSRDKAMSSYLDEEARELVVLSESDGVQSFVVSCHVDFSSQSMSELLDLYVGPTSFEWTIVFPHDPIGPYFARAHWG